MKINTKRTQNRHRTKFFLRSKSHSDIFFIYSKTDNEQKLFSVKSIIGQKILYAKPQTDNYIYLRNPSFIGDMYKTYYSAKTQLVFLFCGKAVS